MSFNPLSFILMGFGVVVLTTGTAQAFTGKDKIPSLKSEVAMSKTDFERATDVIEDVPLGDKSLAYRIRLPKGWTKIDLISPTLAGNSGSEIFRQVASYSSPPRIEEKSMFRIRSIDLTSLIKVDDWFVSYMLQMGFSAEGMSMRSPTEVVAQYTVFEEGEPYITRAVVTLTGAKIIVAEYLVHQDQYEAERDEQILAMSGFKILNPVKGIGIPMKTFPFVDIAKFDYPSNWIVTSPGISNINRMDASIVNSVQTKFTSENGGEIESVSMAGRIDVTVVAKTADVTLPGEIKILNDGLKRNDYKLGAFIETIKDVKVNPLIGKSRIDVYTLEGISKKLAGYEYWVAVLQTGGRFYLVRMITISRGEDFQSWAENTETYRVLIESLGPASNRVVY